MTASRHPPQNPSERAEQPTPQRGRNSGEGSGSAMAAMVKKRREGENHADEAPEHGKDDRACEP